MQVGCVDIHQNAEGFFYDNAFHHYSGETEIGEWIDGKRNGFFKTVNSDRSLLNKGNYSLGVQEGEWHYFHPNGSLQSRGIYKIGARIGQWEFFYPNGQIKELRSFTKGQNYLLYSWSSAGTEMVINGNGPYEFHFKDVLREEGQYKDGLPSGQWKIYNETGQLTREFEHGNAETSE